ncbi:Lactate utilization protein A [Pseudovibrio axinellae]|uniref:Lactate utilization protein A n=1 Tax=Pseudovibrio axinellae TaxID=989403 RepID=A0A165T5T3_9HYPH|nr:(Fe-S)-binding protein [Pseudovibrio axinellae]KZL05476.1 Lactate utilization protein A [Pseudovibrio axinellae]SEP97639.1 L-lactate dehydrogenase complex protein LldE [Pseudovibrio axinellae]
MAKQRRPKFKKDARVGLFVSCTTNLFRPSLIKAGVHLLEKAGYIVEVPPLQNCCGLISLRSGEPEDAKDMAKQVISQFGHYDFVGVLSPFCAAVFDRAYPSLLGEQSEELATHANRFRKSCFEVSDLVLASPFALKALSEFTGSIAFLDVSGEPNLFGSQVSSRLLLGQMKQAHIVDLPQICASQVDGAPDGTISPELGSKGLDGVLRTVRSCGAGTLVSTDLALLMELSSHLRKFGSAIELRPVLEVLAGDLGSMPIGISARAMAGQSLF